MHKKNYLTPFSELDGCMVTQPQTNWANRTLLFKIPCIFDVNYAYGIFILYIVVSNCFVLKVICLVSANYLMKKRLNLHNWSRFNLCHVVCFISQEGINLMNQIC